MSITSAHLNNGVVDPAAIEARLKTFFEADSRGALAVYLFGSVARGEAGPRSDIDIGVLYAQAPPATLDSPPRRLESDLDRFLGLPLQVVTLNGAPPDLIHRVLRDGKLVLDRDRAARIAFEVRARNEYFDMEPIRRLYRRYPSSATDRVAEPGR